LLPESQNLGHVQQGQQLSPASHRFSAVHSSAACVWLFLSCKLRFLMQIIPMDSMGFHEACNIRVDELQVLNMEFLYDCHRPTVALLYHDNKDVRHLRTYEISLKDKVCLVANSLPRLFMMHPFHGA